jgi:hypothetical protein
VCWQFPKQTSLFVPGNRVRPARRSLLHFEQRRRWQPCLSIRMAPDPCSKVQYPSYNRELLVDGSRLPAKPSPVAPVLRQCVVVDTIQRKLTDVRHHDFQRNDIPINRSLMLILLQILYCCLLKRPCRANTVNFCESKTSRTALSLTSGEYRLLLFIALSSQRIESPGKPGRFRHTGER